MIEADPRYSGNPESLITYEKGRFDRDSSDREDLIVGIRRVKGCAWLAAQS